MKKVTIYVSVWAVLIISVTALGLATFGYEDDKNLTLAIMFHGIPGLVTLLDLANFFRYEKYYTHFKFAAVNLLIVLGATFVLESAAILVSFGIANPQVKLFIFAAAFSIMAGVVNLFETGFFALVMKKRGKKH